MLREHLLDMRRLPEDGQVLDGAVEVALPPRAAARKASAAAA